MNWFEKRLSDLVAAFRDHTLLAGLATVGSLYLAHKTVCVLGWVWKQFLRPGRDLYRIYGGANTWAVVTGGSDGIGLAYARLLAKCGFNLLLIARNPDRLAKRKSEILVEAKTRTVETLQLDFSQPYSAAGYQGLAKALEGKEVAVLVNNVGADFACGFAEYAPEMIAQMINLNVNTTTFVTWLMVPKMAARKRRSAIINVSCPTDNYLPYFQVYMASKAYINTLMRYLNQELRAKGIDVLTGLTGQTLTGTNTMSSMWHETADTVAHRQIAALGKDAFTHGSFKHYLYAAYLRSCISAHCRAETGDALRHYTLSTMKQHN